MENKNKKYDFISFADFSKNKIWDLLLLARKLKKNPFSQDLRGRTVGLILQKPSTRTTVSFAVGIVQMGGHPLILNSDVLQIKRGETPKDTGRVLSRYLDGIVIRANQHEEILEMAKFASIPVINGLTDLEHPCQVAADLMTIMEKKKFTHPRQLQGTHVAFMGDGNNVVNSWLLASALLGMKFSLACPKGYEPEKRILQLAKQLLRQGKGEINIYSNPKIAVNKADVIYTDVWTSMGQESERKERLKIFKPYQVNRQLLDWGKKNAIVMHCLPAHRGEEITNEVMESKASVIFDQAENRLHVQKAILSVLIGKNKYK